MKSIHLRDNEFRSFKHLNLEIFWELLTEEFEIDWNPTVAEYQAGTQKIKVILLMKKFSERVEESWRIAWRRHS
jgi:hypothetical protein